MALLGQPWSYCAETSNTFGAYWRNHDVAVIIHSDWSLPKFLRTNTVQQVTLFQDDEPLATGKRP